MNKDEDSSGEFEKTIKGIGGKEAASEIKSMKEQQQQGVRADDQPRRHKHAAGKRVVVHPGEEYHETSRNRAYRKRAEQQRRYQAVKSEETLRRQRRQQRREERRALRHQRHHADEQQQPVAPQPHLHEPHIDDHEHHHHEGGEHKHDDGGAAAKPEEKKAAKADKPAKDEKKGDMKADDKADAKPAAAAAVVAAAPVAAAVAVSSGTVATSSAGGERRVRSVAVKADMNAKHKKAQEDDSLIAESFFKDSSLYVVLDGHAGRAAVDIVLTDLAPTLAANLNTMSTQDDGWKNAFNKTFAEIDEKLKLPGNPGTTIVASAIQSGVLHTANAGDARAVLCDDGKAVRVSYDHKANDEAEVKRCEALGGTFLWGRLQGQTMITRALGDHDIKKFCICEPYYARTPLTAKHQFLILACDGVWDVLDDQKAVDLVKDLALAGDATAAAQKLIDESLRLESKDNLTAMVVCFQ